MSIYDTMQFVKPDISTLCIVGASMGAILLCGGKKTNVSHSKLKSYDSSTPWVVSRVATDFDIQAKEILSIRARLNQILAKNTGQTIKKIESDTERDNFMTSDEALKYGIIDKILDARPED